MSDTSSCPICSRQFKQLGRHFPVHDDSKVREALVGILQDISNEVGDAPTRRDMNEYDGIGYDIFRRRFGSWNEALSEAGLDIHVDQTTNDAPSKEEFISEIERVTEDIGHVPTHEDMKEHGQYTHWPAVRLFGNWLTAVEEADVPMPHRPLSISDEELLDHLRELKDELGRPPIQDEIVYSARTYFVRFGSWLYALRTAGFDVGPGRPDLPQPTGADHWAWKPDKEPIHYGEGWNEEKRQSIRQRDGFARVRCGMSQEDHVNQFDRKLHVHHIIPAQDIDDPSSRNGEDNLISLCIRCHPVVENKTDEESAATSIPSKQS